MKEAYALESEWKNNSNKKKAERARKQVETLKHIGENIINYYIYSRMDTDSEKVANELKDMLYIDKMEGNFLLGLYVIHFIKETIGRSLQ